MAGFALVGAAGCGEPPEQVETTHGAITGGWTNLQLINGWQNYWGTSYPPAVGIVNGVVTFRGAIKATNPTSPVAFRLDDPTFTAFQTYPLDNTAMRTIMSDGKGGTLFFRALDDGAGHTKQMYIEEDGAAEGVVGDKAKAYTQLDGVAFDRNAGGDGNSGTVIAYNYNGWQSKYGFRQNPHGICTGQYLDCGVYVIKNSDGFIRFQGALQTRSGAQFDGFLFTLPTADLIPGQKVVVPTSLGGDAFGNQGWGTLSIYPDGNVYVDGNINAAMLATSFEGVAFSKTSNSNNIALPLTDNWIAYSPRPVRVGIFGGVVRFQGAIKNGTTIHIADLPTGYRPQKTVRLVGAAYGPWPAQIIVEPTGFMWFQGPPMNYAATMLSLDSVSFAL